MANSTPSRRALLKGAAAVGVGAAAFAAPGVSIVPAYGLTKSGVSNGKCYSVKWKGDPKPEKEKWDAGNGGSNGAAGSAASNTDVTYTWTNVDGLLNNLVLRFNGNPVSSTTAITATVPPGCTLVIRDGNPRSAKPTDGTNGAQCVLGTTTVGGSYTTSTASGFTANTDAWVTFDLTC